MSETAFDVSRLYALDPTSPPDVVYFPVRHYSPTSARLLWELAEEIEPSAVLVEGPIDFNDRLDELMLDGHELPIALYTYVRLSDGSKRSAFYPYCEYAPEWQAQLLARERGVPFRFIDLAWERMALETEREHRYSDEHFRRNPYPDALCEKLAVADFDELWDVFFELDPDLDWRGYLRRCHEFCFHLRVFGGPESQENADREACMLEQIELAVAELGGPVLVVTGGFHSSGLYAKRHGLELPLEEVEPVEVTEVTDDEEEVGDEPEIRPEHFDGDPELMRRIREEQEPPTVVEAGITLTPFTYERIDRLSGYASGVHGPAFYQYVWETRKEAGEVDSRDFLYEIVRRLRDRGQLASTADVIGIETTAKALATLRGRREIWRFDLLDAISAAIVKEAQDAEYAHPALMLARDVLRGEKRGAIDPRAPLPPLVRFVRERLDELDLLPVSSEERTVRLSLDDPADLERSRVLHQVRVLGLAGFRFDSGTDFVKRDDLTELWETWTFLWCPEFEGSLIECAVYGTDLEEAATARLQERARALERDAERAAILAIDAVLMGVTDVAHALYDRLAELVGEEADFFSVTRALGHLHYLTGYDEVLGTRGDPALTALLRATYLRSLWLFESLGTVKDRDSELLDAVKCLFETFRHSYRGDSDDRAEFVTLFERTGSDRGQTPLARGASMGVLYALGELDTDRVLATVRSFREAVELGDFLIGFFSLAREAAQRDPRLMRLLDEIICGLAEKEFLEVLPGLRLAFTFFTPLEKHSIVDALFKDTPASESAHGEVVVRPEDAEAGAAIDSRIRVTLARYGLRGSDEGAPVDPGADADLELDTAGDGEGEGEGAGDRGQEEGAAGEEDSEARGDDGDEASSSGEDGREEGGKLLAPEERKERWRMILGAGTEDALGGLTGRSAQRERMLAYLYDREYGRGRNVRGQSGDKKGSLDASQLTVPDWINAVHELFPRRTIERLEKDALDRYQLEELVTRPDVLNRAQPNQTLLKAVLRTRHLMNKEVLEIARRLVRQVVNELMEKLSREIKQPFSGALDRRRRTSLRVAKNFDALETIRRNLKNYDPEAGRIVVERPVFFSRIRRQSDRWQLVIVVDQSGSMLDSVIHAAVTASIFFGIHSLRTHLVAFDTSVVDLTHDAGDPVETLMKVQLGGGTDIANALEYARSLVENPRRTIVVLITDFYEGGPMGHLLGVTKELVESGVTLLGLAALDEQANPDFDRDTAGRMVQLGAHVGAMTPGELAQWVSERVR